MKRFIVVSAVGKDRPGFVNRITHAVKELGGNIELQRSTRMAAEFAMLVLFSLENDEVQNAIDTLTQLRDKNMFINAREALATEEHRPSGFRLAELIASGADQAGIVEAVTMLLFKNHINIESMDYDTESAPFSGEHLFRMTAQLAVPGGVDTDGLKEQFRELEDEYNFDILLR